MKKIFFSIILITPYFALAQFGIKAGLNFAKVSNAASINSSNKSGFNVGLFLAPLSKKILSSRTELVFSRQGYDYKTSSNTGNVNLDYIQMGQLASINITKYVSLLFGAQTAYLISAQADSTKTSGGSSGSYNNIMNLYNRIDYGYALGAEVHPVSGLVIGARYNVSLAKVYKDIQSFQRPSFSSEDAKNNVVQIFAGWRFGKTESKKKKDNN
ncbi:outer membrane beta-barrel protein [Ferruginibacter sp.]|nr:PorT family protein [Ferruginibacter sp.]